MDANTVTWDYSALARPYLKRPDYSEAGLDAMLAITKVGSNSPVCDVGAGLGHLAIPMSKRHMDIIAVEPNEEMRKLGAERTRAIKNISWRAGTGENTGLPSDRFALVTYGSSFNVTSRELALIETHRILRKAAWFACMWNHRNLNDPLQRDVETVIKRFIPDYDYGTRREDQTPIIEKSGLFFRPFQIDAPVIYHISKADWIEAWRSHATLQRQSKGNMPEIVAAIESLLVGHGGSEIIVPYTTRIWIAQARS